MLDFNNMTAGDQYEIKVYEKIDGTNARVLYDGFVDGAQGTAWVSSRFTITNGWEVSLKLLSGTARTVYWSLYKNDPQSGGGSHRPIGSPVVRKLAA